VFKTEDSTITRRKPTTFLLMYRYNRSIIRLAVAYGLANSKKHSLGVQMHDPQKGPTPERTGVILQDHGYPSSACSHQELCRPCICLIVFANRIVRYRSILRSSAVAAAPDRFRICPADVSAQLRITKSESRRPPSASSHHNFA
jgi:hypothetical protein